MFICSTGTSFSAISQKHDREDLVDDEAVVSLIGLLNTVYLQSAWGHCFIEGIVPNVPMFEIMKTIKTQPSIIYYCTIDGKHGMSGIFERRYARFHSIETGISLSVYKPIELSSVCDIANLEL